MCECGEMPSTFRETRPKARRDHKCCECGGMIRAGEVYRSVWGVWDSEQRTYRTCVDCLGLHDWAESDGGELCTTFGNLHVDVLDFMHESGEAALEAEATRRVKDIREKRRERVAA